MSITELIRGGFCLLDIKSEPELLLVVGKKENDSNWTHWHQRYWGSLTSLDHRRVVGTFLWLGWGCFLSVPLIILTSSDCQFPSTDQDYHSSLWYYLPSILKYATSISTKCWIHIHTSNSVHRITCINGWIREATRLNFVLMLCVSMSTEPNWVSVNIWEEIANILHSFYPVLWLLGKSTSTESTYTRSALQLDIWFLTICMGKTWYFCWYSTCTNLLKDEWIPLSGVIDHWPIQLVIQKIRALAYWQPVRLEWPQTIEGKITLWHEPFALDQFYTSNSPGCICSGSQ